MSLLLLRTVTARHASAFVGTATLRASAGRSSSIPLSMAYSNVVVGAPNTFEYKQYFTDDAGAKISPWHDISLKPTGAAADVFNMVTEISKMGTAKMEVDTKGASNPIMQDTKKGKLRFYHGPIFWNYGCLPQTWENPHASHPELGCFGDNDPM